MGYTLETLGPEGETFRWGVFCVTIRPWLERLLGLDESTLREMMRESFTEGQHQAIVVNGTRIGAMLVSETDDLIDLTQIAILPEFQGFGIGSAIVRDLQDRARRSGRAVTLRVFTENRRARELYERLGFVVSDTSEHDLGMRWEPSRVQPDRQTGREGLSQRGVR